MRVTVIDSRGLAVGLAQPGNGKWWDWSKRAWEAGPFAGPAHALPLSPMEPAPSPMAAIQTADITDELLARPDASVVLLAVSGSGAAAQYTPLDSADAAAAARPGPMSFCRF